MNNMRWYHTEKNDDCATCTIPYPSKKLAIMAGKVKYKLGARKGDWFEVYNHDETEEERVYL